ncbi:MAG TPA: DNA repair protein RecN [Verrucomicrobia bacterium]|nr:DNA repair protein RecN [Verrucomicrobiota bacterium]HOP97629.1 DNA repair protein RecN [Verrucomicrobiota bacterium]
MLTVLRIKNLALVPELTLELQPGCNVITGETGAGKSIIIGALNLILGRRADRTLIRSGSDSCSVEAAFDISRLKAPLAGFLSETGLDPCEDGQLVIKRTFTSAGANRQFVNGSPATLSALERIGEWLVDMHGPHDHQSLLHPSRQLDILDAFGGLEKERANFAQLARRRAELESEKTALVTDEQTYLRELDLLRFQVREIADARLQPGEDDEIEQEHRRAANSARLLQLCQSVLDVLGESDSSVQVQLGAAGRLLQELQRIDPGIEEGAALHRQIAENVRDLQHWLTRYSERVDVDPERLQQLEDRLNLLQSLKRKYGSTVADVIAFGQQAAERLQQLERRDETLARLNNELAKLDRQILQAGRRLSSKRREVVPRLCKNAGRHLADLGFRQSRLDVAVVTTEDASRPGPHGFDQIEFQFAPNPGEPARPLRAIASSGELARVMLALKTALAAEDEIPVLVFDEVDANVGGETANAVGAKMAHIAQRRQVICITHLPQVAASAAAHYVVSKRVRDGRTISDIRLLDRRERVTELARMLGGQTETARKHAEALLQ